jgi:hypothetical protein
MLEMMPPDYILTEDFAQAAANAGRRARQDALAAGHPVVYVANLGRYVQEMPDGTLLHVHLCPGAPRNSHVLILGEISTPAS